MLDIIHSMREVTPNPRFNKVSFPSLFSLYVFLFYLMLFSLKSNRIKTVNLDKNSQSRQEHYSCSAAFQITPCGQWSSDADWSREGRRFQTAERKPLGHAGEAGASPL